MNCNFDTLASYSFHGLDNLEILKLDYCTVNQLDDSVLGGLNKLKVRGGLEAAKW